MNVRTLIEQLGYSPHEATVYLAALELGSSTETEIAERAKLARTTVASVIESLQKKGLMSAYLKGRRKIWAAENPERFMAVIHTRQAILKTLLPELQSMRRSAVPPPIMRAFSGVEGIRQIMDDIIETKNHVFAVISWDDWVGLLGKPFLDEFIKTRKEHYLSIRLLTPKTKMSLELKDRDAGDMRVTQFLPGGVTVANTNFIYGNRTAIISVKSKSATGVLIEDEDIHHTMEIFFESLWLRSGGTLDRPA